MKAEDPLRELAEAIAEGREWEAPPEVSQEHRALLEALNRIARVESAHRTIEQQQGEGELGRWGELILLRELAQGAHGTVYEALDLRLDRLVALKLIAPEAESLQRDPAAIAREGKLLARVKHPNVATVYGAERHEGRVGVWMELIRGRTLAKIVADEAPFGAREATLIGVDLCGAIAAIHTQGFLHGDIKAANVMREEGGRIVLMDLGIGQDLQAVEPVDVLGTPLYMAPEVLGGAAPTVRAEVYSLGVLLYFLVTGRFPVTGDSLEALRAAHDTGQHELLRDARPDLPQEFVAVIERAISPAPGDRYSTMGQFERALLGFLGQGGSEGILGARTGRFGMPVGWSRRKKAAVGAGVLLAVVLTTAGVRSWLQQPRGVPAGSRVLLGDVDNLTGKRELDAVREVLRGQLEESPHYRLVTTGRVQELLAQMRRPEDARLSPTVAREAAWRDVASALVYGSLARLGARYRLTLIVEQVGASAEQPDRKASRAFNAANEDRLLDAIDTAARWVRTELGDAARNGTIVDVPARRATSSSWHAIDLYSRYVQRIYEDYAGALALLRQAVSIDPEFALAHARLGSLYAWTDMGAAYREWATALQLGERLRLTTREQLQIEADASLGGMDPTHAAEVYRRWAALYPHDYFPRFGEAYSLRELGRDHEAIERLETSLRTWPEEPLTYARLAELYIDTGDDARAVERLQTLRASHGNDPAWAAVADYYEGRLHFVREQYDQAEAVWQRLMSSENEHWRSRGYSILAASEGERGRFRAARALLAEGLAFDSGRPALKALAARKRLAFAYLSLRDGNAEGVLHQVQAAANLSSDPRLLARGATFLARAGWTDQAAALGDSVPDLGPPLFQVARARAQGEVALARGDTRTARRALVRASDLDLAASEREYLAHALVSLGERQFAFELYRRIAEDPARTIRADYVWETMPGFWADCVEKALPLGDALGLHDETEPLRERLARVRGNGS